jgi:hypothetical protein
MHANLPTPTASTSLKLEFQGDQLPGYGWVFLMGSGRFNIGLLRQQLQELAVDQRRGFPASSCGRRRMDLPPIEELKVKKCGPGGCRWASPLAAVAAGCCSRATRWGAQAGIRRGHLQALES